MHITWDRRSLQAFADEPIGALAGRYDLIVLDHPHVAQIAESGCLLVLSMPDASGSLGGSLESYVWNGELWAVPVDAACQMAVARPDLCARIPATWRELLNTRPTELRIVTPFLPVDAVDMFLSLVASRGEVNLPVSNVEFVSEANGAAALEVLKTLFKRGPAEAVGWNPITVLEALSTTDSFDLCPCLFGYINYARPGFRAHALRYGALPGFEAAGPSRGILGGAGLGVSARSSRPTEARAFARWVSSEPVQSGIYLENEGQPASRHSWDKMGRDPRYSGFLGSGREAMEHAWTRPRDPWFLGFVDDLCEIMPDFFLKDWPVQRFAREMNDLYRRHSSASRRNGE